MGDDGSEGQGVPESSNVTGFKIVIGLISVFLIGFVIAVAYLYMRNKKLERYAVPMLDEHEQIEPRVPEYSDDSDDDHQAAKFGSRAKQEMVTISTSIGNKFKAKMNERKQTKTRKKGKNKYQAQMDNYSDDDNLVANGGDDSDTDDDSD